jgi:hypothetical protein
MKLTYPNGTVSTVGKFPGNFTGTAVWDDGSIAYYVNSNLHRSGGLPAYEEPLRGYNGYWVDGKRTGKFHFHTL